MFVRQKYRWYFHLIKICLNWKAFVQERYSCVAKKKKYIKNVTMLADKIGLALHRLQASTTLNPAPISWTAVPPYNVMTVLLMKKAPAALLHNSGPQHSCVLLSRLSVAEGRFVHSLASSNGESTKCHQGGSFQFPFRVCHCSVCRYCFSVR